MQRNPRRTPIGCPRLTAQRVYPPTQPKTKLKHHQKLVLGRKARNRVLWCTFLLWKPRIWHSSRSEYPPFLLLFCSHPLTRSFGSSFFVEFQRHPFIVKSQKLLIENHLLGWKTWIPFGISGCHHHQNYPPGRSHHMAPPTVWHFWLDELLFWRARWDILVA